MLIDPFCRVEKVVKKRGGDRIARSDVFVKNAAEETAADIDFFSDSL
jgi:hypothetical protein